ncbi:MAG: 5'-nucleotidase, lipoprotein e(P4) family [Ferruginibacter sp.]
MKKIVTAATAMLFCLGSYCQQTMPVVNNCESVIKEYPVLWQQQAAEYRALCYQAFNLAELRLSELSRKKLRKGHLAIITDLDETILDNSYSEAQLMKEGKTYNSKSWKDWLEHSAATGVPGAVAFLKKAKEKGISIFYISNRKTADIQSTLLNLQKLGLPDVDTLHMFFQKDSSSKESRRQLVMQHYNVLMLLGDNLNDFTYVFENKNVADRFTQTDKMMDEWGKRFIVLPNAVYGDWENAIYNYKFNYTPEEKAAIRMQLLVGY